LPMPQLIEHSDQSCCGTTHHGSPRYYEGLVSAKHWTYPKPEWRSNCSLTDDKSCAKPWKDIRKWICKQSSETRTPSFQTLAVTLLTSNSRPKSRVNRSSQLTFNSLN
jgi:hypothetical protein